MRTYESIIIVHPEVAGDTYQGLLDKYKEVLNQQNATLHKIDEWGNRTLAYPIQKQSKGTFVLFVFDAAPEGLAELERRFRLDESVIKFQSVLLEKFDPSTLEAPKPAAEAETASPAEESASSSEEEKGEEKSEESED
ncbi:MAG: 30S ribosomal protein S6 [Deltaproteobacteria bacterium]|nr:30S ribosomal protein S6 [Deltaproteobacteria bacterium]